MPELRTPSPPALDALVGEARTDSELHLVVDLVEDASEQNVIVSTPTGDRIVEVLGRRVSISGLKPNSMHTLSSRASRQDTASVESARVELWTRPTAPIGQSICTPMGGNVALLSWSLESLGSAIPPPLLLDIDAEMTDGARHSLARAAPLAGSVVAQWVPGQTVAFHLYSDLGAGLRNDALHPLRASLAGAAMLPPPLICGDRDLEPSAAARLVLGVSWSRPR